MPETRLPNQMLEWQSILGGKGVRSKLIDRGLRSEDYGEDEDWALSLIDPHRAYHHSNLGLPLFRPPIGCHSTLV